MNVAAVRWMRSEVRSSVAREGFEPHPSTLAARCERALKLYPLMAEAWNALEEDAWRAIKMEREAPAMAAKLAEMKARAAAVNALGGE